MALSAVTMDFRGFFNLSARITVTPDHCTHRKQALSASERRVQSLCEWSIALELPVVTADAASGDPEITTICSN